jgi:hypothetical protein
VRAAIGGRTRAFNLRWRKNEPNLDSLVRGRHRERRCDSASNGTWMQLRVGIETSLLFGAMRPIAYMGLRTAVVPAGPIPLFIDNAAGAVALNAWLGADGHEALLAALRLGDGEDLLVARNAIVVTFRTAGVRRHLDLLDAVSDLADALPPDTSDEAPAALPDALAHLQPLADRWAIDDDSDRAEAIETATDDDLRALVAAVTSHVNDAPTDELFGRLAEAAAEARLELERRDAL